MSALRHVIIGAGEAGVRAAMVLRELGAESITLIGEEPEAPYERPPLSKPDGEGVTVRPLAADYDGIDARFGVKAESIDRQGRRVTLMGGAAIPYDRLLIATGARARRLACDPEGIALTLRARAEAEAIFARAKPGARAVIIGAGLIGLELAAAFSERGVATTILEAGPRALGRALPALAAEALTARHESAGTRFVFNARLKAVAPGRVITEDEAFAADLIVAAVGASPDARLAEAAGLACSDGILTDAEMRTSDAAIFAAGDCARVDHARYGLIRLESWRAARDEADTAARAMMGETMVFDALPWFWSDQLGWGLQMAGRHDPARRAVRRDLAKGGWLLFELGPEGAVEAVCGLAPGQSAARDVRLAETLIARGARPSPEALADPAVGLKSLIRPDAAAHTNSQ